MSEQPDVDTGGTLSTIFAMNSPLLKPFFQALTFASFFIPSVPPYFHEVRSPEAREQVRMLGSRLADGRVKERAR